MFLCRSVLLCSWRKGKHTFHFPSIHSHSTTIASSFISALVIFVYRSAAILSSAADHGPIGLHNRGTKPSTGLPGHPTTDFGQLKKSSPHFSKQQFDVAPTAGSKWLVQQLEPLPAGFPLERSSRRVNATGSIVAERITACLFERSIETEYNDVEGKAKCRTLDYVYFRIRLFASSDDTDSITTIVEVQRRKGSAFNFMKDCRAILDAAEGRASSFQTAMPPLKPISAMSCLQGVKIDNDDDSDGADIKGFFLFKINYLPNRFHF